MMEPFQGNAYEIQETLPEESRLPSNLRDATRLFRASGEAKELFGQDFVEHFACTREWEVREYENRLPTGS